MRPRGSRLLGPGLLALVMGWGADVLPAQTAPDLSCPAECAFDQALQEPFEITSAGGLLATILRIGMQDTCVPVWRQVNNVWQCTMTPMKLRSYGYPDAKGNFIYRFPGPTLRVHKPSKEGGMGDRIAVHLVNALPLEPPAGPDGCLACDCSQTPQPACCNAKDLFPNCFHGSNSTNLHFHGAHVSPQAAQDYVLLELLPAGSALPAGDHAHGRGTIAVGTFQYVVDPLRWTQPEGTHWYHPHKHGSVGQQVGDGMAGALIIEGKFDQWLRQLYAGKKKGLEEKLLVIQQIHSLNFTAQNTLLPQPLINGQASPSIQMCPGQVQRWRFVGATMEGGAQITIQFNGPAAAVRSALGIAEPPAPGAAADCPRTSVCARQIAMDGVQFAPESYGEQPLLPQGIQNFSLSPGNRADFLVRAPSREGKYRVTYDVFGSVESSLRRELLRSFLENAKAGQLKAFSDQDIEAGVVPAGRLLTVEVKKGPDCPEPETFPTQAQWPPMPAYLEDVTDIAQQRDLWFDMRKPDNTPAAPPVLPSKFYVNLQENENRQYDPSCVDITTTLDTGEEWTVRNTTRVVTPNIVPPAPAPAAPFHVFHIHTNPFQVMEAWGLKEEVGPTSDDREDVCQRIVYDPPLWQDSVTLPSACNVDGKLQPGYVKIRQRFEEFTGEYVLHCHFLGHEDRGMMLGVQTVCPAVPGMAESYGSPRTVGDECVPGNYIPAAPRCPTPNPAPTTAAASGHER